MIKAVIFDSDGMLTYDPGFSRTYSRKHGIPFEEMLPFFKGPFKECLIGKADLKEELQRGWLEKWGWKKSTDDLLAYWFSVGSPPNPEILSTVLHLKEKGIMCVMATNQEKYRTEYMLEEFKYGKIFDKVFSSAYVGHKKPSTEFFDAVFQYVHGRAPGVSRGEVMFWDDDIENVEGARSYGFEAHQFLTTRNYQGVIKDLM